MQRPLIALMILVIAASVTSPLCAVDIKDGAIISLENRARPRKFLDIDGSRGRGNSTMMPLQKYTSSGGCDWILDYTGVKDTFHIENRFDGKYLAAGKNFGEVVLEKSTSSDRADWRFVELSRKDDYILINKYWTKIKREDIVLDINGRNNMPIVGPNKYTGCDWQIANEQKASDSKPENVIKLTITVANDGKARTSIIIESP